MDIRGTEQADVYDQTAAGPTEWHDYYGLGGNDTARLWMGQVIGGAGNDLIENLSAPGWTGQLHVAYWDAPAGAVVDLAAGTAQDGWGTTDTLIGVDGVNGGGRNDRFYGNAGDNSFSSGGGRDTIDGRDGNDSVVLPTIAGTASTLNNLTIAVSVDGRTATITSTRDSNFRLDLIDVERFALDWKQPFLNLSDFIDPQAMAQQGLLGLPEQRWNASSAMGTATTVSFSFVAFAPASGPGATGFRAFTNAERQIVRDLLADTQALTGLRFVEVNEATGAQGQMRFGVSQQTQTKGLAYPPSVLLANAAAGDVWMDTDSMVNLSPGSEGYAALRHEIGHALGLRHPRNVDPGDAWAQQLRAADDVTALTVMSATASPDGEFRADWGWLDIAALRSLYGHSARHLGDTVHTVGGTDAQAQRTLIDDGGLDTLNASSSPVGGALNLRPAHLSSVGLTSQGHSALGNLGLGADTWLENAIGSAYDDVLIGNGLANSLEGGLGNDWIDGGEGTDTAVFSGVRANYTISTEFGYLLVQAQDGTSGFDTLSNIERLSFADMGLRVSDMSIETDSVVPTVITFTPGDDASKVAVASNLTLSFSEPIARGSGTIALKTLNGAVLESYNAASSANLTISGNTLTVNPTPNLAHGKGYYLEFAPGAVQDAAGNAYAGGSGYNFTTTLVNPADPKSAYYELSQKFYLAYFGRAADTGGLNNMAQQLSDSGAPTTTLALLQSYDSNHTVKNIIDCFGLSAESRALYGNVSTTAIVTAVYHYILGRSPDAEGLAFWVGAIDSGNLSLAKASLSIMEGAEKYVNADGLTVVKKVTVAQNFTTALDTPAEANAYAGNAAALAVRNMLGGVSNSSDTGAYQATVQGTIDQLVAASAGGLGATGNLELAGVWDGGTFGF